MADSKSEGRLVITGVDRCERELDKTILRASKAWKDYCKKVPTSPTERQPPAEIRDIVEQVGRLRDLLPARSGMRIGLHLEDEITEATEAILSALCGLEEQIAALCTEKDRLTHCHLQAEEQAQEYQEAAESYEKLYVAEIEKNRFLRAEIRDVRKLLKRVADEDDQRISALRREVVRLGTGRIQKALDRVLKQPKD